MTELAMLADEDWRVQIDECDINAPTIAYSDPDKPRCFVGPLVTVHVGSTVDDDEGNEALDLEGADGRNLAAVACLPQFAELLCWIELEQAKLNSVHFDSQNEYGQFMLELRERTRWIAACINDRQETMGPGMHGFDKYRPPSRGH